MVATKIFLKNRGVQLHPLQPTSGGPVYGMPVIKWPKNWDKGNSLGTDKSPKCDNSEISN